MHASLRHLGIAYLALTAIACGDKGTASDDGSGGSSGSSTGGSATGGSTGAGGSGGSASGTGGASGSGTGGSNVGGSAGEAASGEYSFDDNVEGWIVQYTSSADGVDLIATTDVVLEWNETDGNPGGVLRAEIPYTDAGQYVGFGISLPQTAPLNLSGATVTAEVKIDSGVGDADDLMTNPAGAKIYAKTGLAYVYGAGLFTNVTEIGEWITLTFNMDLPDYVDETNGVFDPSQVLEIGVQFDTGGTSMSAQEGVILIDNVSY